MTNGFMRSMLALVVLASLAMPTAGAHEAPQPADHETRLLHDCVDDYFGGDSAGGQSGYDIHALDLYEQWVDGLGNVVTYKLILNGEGGATIHLDLSADGAGRSYQWTSQSGSSWSGSFDRVTKIDDLDDGDRFALEGRVALSTLGVGPGDDLGDHEVQVELPGGSDGDRMPGYDGGPLGSCEGEYNPPGRTHTVAGPTQYASLDVREDDVTVDVDEERFLNVEAQNDLKDTTQTITLTHSGGDGVLVRFHDPGSGDGSGYSQTYQDELGKRGRVDASTLVHLAIKGEQADASGTVTVTLTTDMGGRVQDTFAYGVGGAAPPTTDDDPDDGAESDDNGIPGPGAAVAVAALGTLLLLRRRT